MVKAGLGEYIHLCQSHYLSLGLNRVNFEAKKAKSDKKSAVKNKYSYRGSEMNAWHSYLLGYVAGLQKDDVIRQKLEDGYNYFYGQGKYTFAPGWSRKLLQAHAEQAVIDQIQMIKNGQMIIRDPQSGDWRAKNVRFTGHSLFKRNKNNEYIFTEGRQIGTFFKIIDYIASKQRSINELLKNAQKTNATELINQINQFNTLFNQLSQIAKTLKKANLNNTTQFKSVDNKLIGNNFYTNMQNLAKLWDTIRGSSESYITGQIDEITKETTARAIVHQLNGRVSRIGQDPITKTAQISTTLGINNNIDLNNILKELQKPVTTQGKSDLLLTFDMGTPEQKTLGLSLKSYDLKTPKYISIHDGSNLLTLIGQTETDAFYFNHYLNIVTAHKD